MHQNRKKINAAVFLDLSKIFDSINHVLTTKKFSFMEFRYQPKI